MLPSAFAELNQVGISHETFTNSCKKISIVASAICMVTVSLVAEEFWDCDKICDEETDFTNSNALYNSKFRRTPCSLLHLQNCIRFCSHETFTNSCEKTSTVTPVICTVT